MSEPNQPMKTVKFSVRQLMPQKALHYLTVIQGVTTVRAVPVAAEALVLGRDPSLPFALPDADVSRAHCEVRLVGESVRVRDLDSTNGTFVDGVRVIVERDLPVSSRLQVGRHAFRHELLSPEDVAAREQFARDLEQARRYVEALLPAPLAQGPLRTEWCFVPSSVLGGDALGYHDLPGGRLALYVLDVCGHGVASAMHSASVLNTLRNHTLPETRFDEPGQVLGRLNHAFPMEAHSGMYFSLFYGVVDPVARRLRYASAGHPPAIVLGRDGTVRCRLPAASPPIGTIAGRAFEHAETSFEPGERLYVFSDGVYELQDREGRERGLEDFERALVVPGAHRAGGESRRLYDAACELAGTGLLPDDFTLLRVEHAPAAAS